MPSYTLSRAEQETILRWDAETRVASIDTADPVTIRKLDKLTADHPDVYKCVREDSRYEAKRYEVPSQYIRFGKPASEARREASRRSSPFSPKAHVHVES